MSALDTPTPTPTKGRINCTDAEVMAAIAAGETATSIEIRLHTSKKRVAKLKAQAADPNYQKPEPKWATDDEIEAAIEEYQSIATVARLLGTCRKRVRKIRNGMQKINIMAMIREAAAKRDAAEPEAITPVSAPAQDGKAEVRIAELEAALADIRRLIVPAQPIVVPTARDPGPIFTPLGDGRPYAHTIFGVEGTITPRIIAPVSSLPIRLLAIGDSHFHPGLPQTLRCMRLVGLHAASTMPDHVLHIGDGSDWNSVCRHTRNDTWKARVKPSLRQDLDCWRDNWRVLNDPMDDAGVTRSRHYHMGNHDAWVEEFEDSHPEVVGMATGERDDVLRRHGWTWSPYGEVVFFGGVGATHAGLTVMGRPFGGVATENTLAMNSVHDLIVGHTHRENRAVRTKVGLAQKVTVVNVGSSMPELYVGDYAQRTAGSAVSSGVCDITIFDGRIQSSTFVTMRELERRYGAQADRTITSFGGGR